MAACVAEATAEEPDWSSLPAGVVRHIMGCASTCQAPGSCLGAPVCRQWRSAAASAGHKGIRLLYQVGHGPSDQSFAAWLAVNSRQLGSLTLTTSTGDPNGMAVIDVNTDSVNLVLGALAQAATAAAAAGSPVPQHTQRVQGVGPSLAMIGQLLAGLSHLHTLQLNMCGEGYPDMAAYERAMQDHLAPLKAATQLQNLYMTMPRHQAYSISGIGGLLPASLKRLSWKEHAWSPAPPDLAHLSQLSFLQLEGWRGWDSSASSSRLPGSLQELRLHMVAATLAQLQQQQDILAEGPWHTLKPNNCYHLPRFTNIQSLVVVGDDLPNPPTACVALKQLTKLSALKVFTNTSSMQPVVSAVSSLAGLRHLHLRVGGFQLRPGLAAACTQLTQLVVQSIEFDSTPQQLQQQQGSWVPELGRMEQLRWLSVPGLLLAADQAWLGGLKQLQVLVLTSEGSRVGFQPPQVLPQVVEGLERCSPHALPPRLLMLGVTGVTAEEAAALHVRRRLQRSLSSNGCEVVVGVDLDEVADPVKQLAGLPVALQQAVA